ncbi:MAG: pantetheine-phosphate adenylyltransferase [Trueperaceae bacterium]
MHALYPGSFDPIHNGHLDIIERASKIFDRVTVAALHNSLKDKGLFSIEERLDIIASSVQQWPNVNAEKFEGLLVNYAERVGAQVILKGLRTTMDFENELQMAHMNRLMYPPAETLLMMTDTDWSHLSSSRIRELASFQADVSTLVPVASLAALRRKFSSN